MSNYVVVLGAPASMSSLERTLREACQSLEVEPLLDARVGEAFPEAASMVYFGLRLDSRKPPVPRSDGGDSGFVSRRRTPTALLRRVIALAATRFGAVQLLVHHGEARSPDPPLRDCRTASTTLAGFLRSGRVVQEDTLLNVRLVAARTRRQRATASK